MPITTFLHDSELNKPTGNNEIDKLLAEVRLITGRDYQVIATKEVVRFGFLDLRKRLVTRMSVYVLVGGIGPWQWLTCAHDIDTTRSYLLGVLNGLDHASGLTRVFAP